MARLRVWLGLAGLAAVVGLVGCGKQPALPEPVRAVKLVTVGEPGAGAAQEFAAEVRARSEVRLGFRVAGKLVSRSVEVGQRVAAGQVLAQLDATDYALAAQAAQAQIQAARTQRDLAAADVKRFADLHAQGFISAAELDRRQAALRAAQASLDQALALAQGQANQQGYATLRADKPGVVVAVEAEPGLVLAAGAPVLRLAVDGPRDVVVSVPEQQVAAVRVGQRAQVSLWAGGPPRQAVVREVAASADAVTRTFVVKLALQGGGSEVPLGSTASVRLQPDGPAAGVAAGLVVPVSALWAQGQDSAVWVFDEASRTVRAQPVELAQVDGTQALVRAGLQPGQRVVATGVHVLSEGQVVTVYAENPRSQAAWSLSVQATSAMKNDVPAGSAAAVKERP